MSDNSNYQDNRKNSPSKENKPISEAKTLSEESMIQVGTATDQAANALARDVVAPFQPPTTSASIASSSSREITDVIVKAREDAHTGAMTQAVATDDPLNPAIADPVTPVRKSSGQGQKSSLSPSISSSSGSRPQTIGGAFSGAKKQLQDFLASTAAAVQPMVDGATEQASTTVSSIQVKANETLPDVVKETLSNIGIPLDPAQVNEPDGTIPVQAIPDVDEKEETNVTEAKAEEFEKNTEEWSVSEEGAQDRRASLPETDSPGKAGEGHGEKRKSSF